MNAFKVALAAAALCVVSGTAGAASLSLKNFPAGGYGSHVLTPAFDLQYQAGWSTYAGTTGTGTALTTILWNAKDGDNGLQVDGPAKVTYTYLGSEAGFDNKVDFSAGGSIFTESNSLGNTDGPSNILAGLLEFVFKSNADGSVFNNDGATQNMNIGYLLLSSTSFLVFLDDYGAGPDSDYDDIGIRVEVSAVPLPPSAIMLLTAIGGLGLLGRRRRARA